jgi:hypothetical protein
MLVYKFSFPQNLIKYKFKKTVDSIKELQDAKKGNSEDAQAVLICYSKDPVSCISILTGAKVTDGFSIFTWQAPDNRTKKLTCFTNLPPPSRNIK